MTQGILYDQAAPVNASNIGISRGTATAAPKQSLYIVILLYLSGRPDLLKELDVGTLRATSSGPPEDNSFREGNVQVMYETRIMT